MELRTLGPPYTKYPARPHGCGLGRTNTIGIVYFTHQSGGLPGSSSVAGQLPLPEPISIAGPIVATGDNSLGLDQSDVTGPDRRLAGAGVYFARLEGSGSTEVG